MINGLWYLHIMTQNFWYRSNLSLWYVFCCWKLHTKIRQTKHCEHQNNNVCRSCCSWSRGFFQSDETVTEQRNCLAFLLPHIITQVDSTTASGSVVLKLNLNRWMKWMRLNQMLSERPTTWMLQSSCMRQPKHPARADAGFRSESQRWSHLFLVPQTSTTVGKKRSATSMLTC